MKISRCWLGEMGCKNCICSQTTISNNTKTYYIIHHTYWPNLYWSPALHDTCNPSNCSLKFTYIKTTEWRQEINSFSTKPTDCLPPISPHDNHPLSADHRAPTLRQALPLFILKDWRISPERKQLETCGLHHRNRREVLYLRYKLDADKTTPTTPLTR